jgi:hypothetical protein
MPMKNIIFLCILLIAYTRTETHVHITPPMPEEAAAVAPQLGGVSALDRTTSNTHTYTYSNAHPNDNKKVISWMHIPKTSSWIGDLILAWGCPKYRMRYRQYLTEIQTQPKRRFFFDSLKPILAQETGCDVRFETQGVLYGGHLPHTDPVGLNHSVVTMFREPISRVVSAFFFCTGPTAPFLFPLGFTQRHDKVFRLEVIRKVFESSNPLLSYATMQEIPSCQMKMVLGIECGKPVALQEADIIEAKRRIREDFHFFGLMEEAEATAHLYRAMYGHWGTYDNGQPLPSPGTYSQLIRSKKKSGKCANTAHQNATSWELAQMLRNYGFADYFDQQLYEEAKRVFYERCRRYGIRTKIGLR